jgi:hypothetical protein
MTTQLTALLLSCSLCSFAAAANCSANDTARIEGLLSTGTTFINNEWNTSFPSKFDPLRAVNATKHNFDSGGLKTLCSATCGVQLASCHAMELKLDHVDIAGLRDVAFVPLALELCGSSTDGKCPFGNDTMGPLTDGLYGTVGLTAVAKKVTATVDVLSHGGGIRYICKDAFKKWSELFWKGVATCTVDATLAASASACYGQCNANLSSDVFAVSTAVVDKTPSLKLKNFDCKFKNGQGELPAGIVNDFKDHITDAIQAAFKKDAPAGIDQVNGLIGGYLADFNVPTQCTPN